MCDLSVDSTALPRPSDRQTRPESLPPLAEERGQGEVEQLVGLLAFRCHFSIGAEEEFCPQLDFCQKCQPPGRWDFLRAGKGS